MSISKLTAGVFGGVYFLVGVIGFIAVLTTTSGGTTNLLGLFPITPLHNVVHLLVGGAGIAAYASGPAMSRTYAQVTGVVLGLIAVLGIFIQNSLGFLPIGGLDIVLHAASALVLLYVGFVASAGETAGA